MKAHAEVERLLSEMAVMSKDYQAASKLSDQISVLCRGYMTPRLETEWDVYKLSPKECRVMDVLMARFGQIVSIEPMMDAVYWDRPNDVPEDSILKVFITHIRKKIKHSPYAIETAFGHGYRLVKTC